MLMFKSKLKLYHVSNPENRKSILSKGLLPSIGLSQLVQHKISRKRIFLKSTNDYDSTYDDDRYLILLPNYISKKLKKDKEMSLAGNNSWYLDNIRIPKKFIKLIYKGTGESTF